MSRSALPRHDDTELLFLPLGGAGEIGMNLYLYGTAGKWLMVDLGITFGDDTTPGIEVMMADPRFIEGERRDLVGLVVTHGHEDHIGAIPHLWRRLRCPVYATPFTAALLRRKLVDAGLEGEVPLTIVPLSGRLSLPPFELELVTLTHSIPEPNALAIRTALGTVLHTGDWRFDPDPIIGEASDLAALRRIGDEGVLALVGDSTNVLVPGRTESERTVEASLEKLFARSAGRIAVTCFASNVGRIESITRAALACGRHVALIGRSLWRVYEAARETGYLADLPPFVEEAEAGFLPRDKVVLICTGSQGEPRAAMAKIAAGGHPEIVLEAGDRAVFSARAIPGNERAILRVQNRLAAMGIEVITEEQAHVHVSGHPARDELVEMYQLIRPRIAVPVHGEERHLLEHAKLAGDCQVPETIVPRNGAMIRLAPGPATVVDEVPTGRLAVDGDVLRPFEGTALRERRRLLHNGAMLATLVLDGKGRLLAEPIVSLEGLAETESAEEMALVGEAIEAVRGAVEALPQKARRDDQPVEDVARQALRRVARASFGKKPLTRVHLVRV